MGAERKIARLKRRLKHHKEHHQKHRKRRHKQHKKKAKVRAPARRSAHHAKRHAFQRGFSRIHDPVIRRMMRHEHGKHHLPKEAEPGHKSEVLDLLVKKAKKAKKAAPKKKNKKKASKKGAKKKHTLPKRILEARKSLTKATSSLDKIAHKFVGADKKPADETKAYKKAAHHTVPKAVFRTD